MANAQNLQIARAKAKKYGIDPDLFVAQMDTEAHGDDLTSPAGAQGPAQIMPGTAKSWGVKNVHDPNEAYDAAARNMAAYTRQYGAKGALVAYNAGPGRVGKALPAETRAYVAKIMGARGSTASAPSSAANATAPIAKQPSTTSTSTVPDVNSALVQALISGHGKGGLLQRTQALIASGQYTKTETTTTPTPSPSGGVSVTADQLQTAASNGQGVDSIIAEANLIDKAHVPYLWAGGHQAKQVDPNAPITPLDCSGAVSRVLGIDPRVSGDLAKWGKPGKGSRVTIWANAEHVVLQVDGKFWGTSRSNPGGGAGWIEGGFNTQGYVARHPNGM